MGPYWKTMKLVSLHGGYKEQDGSSHRTIDLSLFKKHWKRETHNSNSPIHLSHCVYLFIYLFVILYLPSIIQE